MVTVKIKKLDHFDANLPLPSYQTNMAAGADIRACIGEGKELTIGPGERLAVPTGLSFEIPDGHEIQVRPRSGLSLKTGLMVVNAPGTIDSDYRGEVKVILGNLGQNKEVIAHGDRLAQIVLAPVLKAHFVEESVLADSERGSGGFGSTGRS